MNTALYRTIKAAFWGLIALSAQSLTAEEAPQPYHIEVIVFERLATAYDAPEHWRKDFALAYPPNYRLIRPDKHLLPDETDLVPSTSLETDYVQATLEMESNTTELNSVAAPLAQRNARALPERPAEAYELNPQATSINRKSQMRVLFHKAWQQALIPTKQAPYVVLTGGEAFDGVHELGGTIRFSVNKYIHVDTQLWLTQFGPNYGQESEWPTPPIEPTLATPIKTASVFLLPEEEAPIEYGINQGSVASITKAPQFSGTVLGQNNFNSRDALDSTQARQYLANEIIVLEQSRRMRSRELHYIDHPRLGILVKIIPLSFEEAAKLAPNSDAQ